MDAPYVIILLAGGALLACGFVVAARVDRQRRASRWDAFARELELELEADDVRIDVRSRTVELSAQVEGIATLVCETPDTTAIVCETVEGGVEFDLHRRLAPSSERTAGLSQEFDNAFALNAAETAGVGDVLTPEIQERLLGFAGSVFVQGGLISNGSDIRLYRSNLRMSDLRDAILLAVAIAKSVPKRQDSGSSSRVQPRGALPRAKVVAKR